VVLTLVAWVAVPRDVHLHQEFGAASGLAGTVVLVETTSASTVD